MLVASMTSCKKTFIELSPPTSLTPEQALATEADLQVALRGAYAGMRGVDYYGRTLPVLGDIMADNTYQSALNTNRYTFFNDYSDSKGATSGDGNAQGLWSTAYTIILRANNIINSPLAASVNASQYKGEAYAIRALAYFNLVRYFARPYSDNPAGLGVPIITTYDPDLKPARNTVAEVYTLMIADLNQAYTLMTRFTNSSQFSKYAAKGLQAKVYLNMGDKANAKTAALDVINNSGFTTLSATNHASYWNGIGPRTDKVETLMEVSSDATANLAFDELSYIYSQIGNYGDLLSSDELYGMFETSDVRKGLYYTGTRGGVPAVFINKYPTFNPDPSDKKVLRMSEMYLIAAEASLPTNEADALTYVNAITSNRGASPIVSTGTQLFEDIINERRKELAFEGDRFHDLQRLKRAIVRSTNYPASSRNIPYNVFRRLLPIPQVEIDANPAIKPQQNTGY